MSPEAVNLRPGLRELVNDEKVFFEVEFREPSPLRMQGMRVQHFRDVSVSDHLVKDVFQCFPIDQHALTLLPQYVGLEPTAQIELSHRDLR